LIWPDAITSTTFNPNKVTAAQFAIDRHIEQSQIAMVLGQLQLLPDRPDVFGLEWPLLANDPAIVPDWMQCANGG